MRLRKGNKFNKSDDSVGFLDRARAQRDEEDNDGGGLGVLLVSAAAARICLLNVLSKGFLLPGR